MIIISLFLVIIDISIVSIIVNLPYIGIIAILLILSNCLPSFSLKVIPQSRILIKSNSLELSIGIKPKYCQKGVICKADDRHRIVILSFGRQCIEIGAILYGCHKEDQVSDCKEDADKDEDHNALVVTLMLDDVQNEKEEKTKDGLQGKLLPSHEVEDYYDQVRNHEDCEDEFEGLSFLGWRNHLWTQTAETHFKYYIEQRTHIQRRNNKLRKIDPLKLKRPSEPYSKFLTDFSLVDVIIYSYSLQIVIKPNKSSFFCWNIDTTINMACFFHYKLKQFNSSNHIFSVTEISNREF